MIVLEKLNVDFATGNSHYCIVIFLFLHLTEKVKDVISVGLIVLGAFVAGARDLSFDFYGYAVVFAANFTTAIYLATISRIGSTHTCFFLLEFLVISMTFLIL